MRRPEINRFIAVSPPVGIYDFGFLAPCPVSGQIISGSLDSFIDLGEVSKLVVKANTKKNVTVDHMVVNSADHFFNYQVKSLIDTIKGYVLEEERKKIANM